MATGNVNKRTVDALKAGPEVSFLWDDDVKGFGVKITPAGALTYIYQYRMGGREAKTRRYSIGAHGSPWTPASARIEAKRLGLLVAQGIDPAELESWDFEHFLVQPMDCETREQSVEAAIELAMERPRWRLSLQNHKLVGLA